MRVKFISDSPVLSPSQTVSSKGAIALLDDTVWVDKVAFRFMIFLMPEFKYFSPQNVNLTVLQRRAADMFTDALTFYGEVLLSPGYKNLCAEIFPSRTAYRSAVYRLRKAGIITYKRGRNKIPVLHIDSKNQFSQGIRDPRKFWNKKWRGVWYVLVYDFPEDLKLFRKQFRKFLSLLRAGRLQRSVWVVPRDIRPEYDDIQKALDLDYMSYLFASRTPFGYTPDEIVRVAWDFEALRWQQTWFIETCWGLIERLKTKSFSREALNTLAHEAVTSYVTVMEKDPLLPKKLWPFGYQGLEVYRIHMQLAQLIKRQISRT